MVKIPQEIGGFWDWVTKFTVITILPYLTSIVTKKSLLDAEPHQGL